MIPQTTYYAYCKCRQCNETFKVSIPKKYAATSEGRKEQKIFCIYCNSTEDTPLEEPIPFATVAVADITSIIKEEVIWYPYMRRYV